MRTTSITAHYERKLNTGDYSSVTLSAWATVEVEPGDDPAAALAHGMELCRAQVRDAAAPFVKRNGINVNEQFAGAPVRNNGRSDLGVMVDPHDSD